MGRCMAQLAVFAIIKKGIDKRSGNRYNITCVKKIDDIKLHLSGCGSAWLERLIWVQEAAGSNPVTPMMRV